MTALAHRQGLSVTRHLLITPEPIPEAALVQGRRLSRAAGAAVSFVGVVRGTEADQPIQGLAYEAFARMAEHQLHKLCDEVERRWPVESVRLVHRVGLVKAGEVSLWLEVVAPHRGEAFAACQWLIEELKRVVPIWKKPVP